MSSLELELREKLNVTADPTRSPIERLRHLFAFWQHFTLHRRKCDKTDKDLISVFAPSCPYPVWNRAVWLEDTARPSAEVNLSKPVFEQFWELFRRCPIPHNTGLSNENCDYTDDWWNSKNCYLSHSGLNCQDLHYCYRTFECKDCRYCVFSFNSEKCSDLLNCHTCTSVNYAYNCRNCVESAFLFDCRNCSDCLMCWNLRNKRYCIRNNEYSAKDYATERAKYDFNSRKTYCAFVEEFERVIQTDAWWRGVEADKCEESSGAYIENTKRCENCYLMSECQDCINVSRALELKDALDAVGSGKSERVANSSLVWENCVDIYNSFHITSCVDLEYCGFCHKCKHCFGCCSLIDKEYYILNKEYSKEDYFKLVAKLKEKIRNERLEGQFFPAHFSPCPYDESLAGFFLPLSIQEQSTLGFRSSEPTEQRRAEYLPSTNIPDTVQEAPEILTQQRFWDEISKKPFQITKFDIKFSRDNVVPLPEQYYIRRIQDHCRWMFYNGTLRETRCAKNNETLFTHLPSKLDSRILSQSEYEKLLY